MTSQSLAIVNFARRAMAHELSSISGIATDLDKFFGGPLVRSRFRWSWSMRSKRVTNNFPR
jgi:hypothetical protein